MASSPANPFPYHTERIAGREVEKHRPDNPHAGVENFLLFRLATLISANFRVMPELNILCGSDLLVPDLMVVRKAARYADGNLAEPPAFAIEILARDQTFGELMKRADRLVVAGTPFCWMIWPERRKAWIYTGDDFAEARESLTAKLNDSESITISLPELWADLDDD